jgi:two-component system, chemotaxis family, response regulator Rcp1
MAVRTWRKPVEILLVEDSAGDAELMVEALEESNLAVRVTVIEDGELAVCYLRRQGIHHNAIRPDLILLDLHLPRKNGHEVLSDIKQDDSLRLIPVVLMTGFDTEEAITKAYERHANCCVRKPSDLDQFAQAVRQIETFWLRTVRRHHDS